MSAPMVNSRIAADQQTIRQPDFDLPRQRWSLQNHVRTTQLGHSETDGV